MKKTIEKIKSFPSNLQIHWYDEEKKESLDEETFYGDDTAHGIDTINFDGCQGEYTREVWLEDPAIAQYSDHDKEEIITALDQTCNVDFFLS